MTGVEEDISYRKIISEGVYEEPISQSSGNKKQGLYTKRKTRTPMPPDATKSLSCRLIALRVH